MSYAILVVDDQLIVRNGMEAILRTLPCVGRIAAVANGKEAIDALAKESFDFVFMDIRMPVMDGLEATRKLTDLYADLKIIALTVYEDDRYLREMFECGARGYLLKNTDPEEIESAMRSIAHGGLYYSKAISDRLLQCIDPKNKTAKEPVFSLCAKKILFFLWRELSTKEIAVKLKMSIKAVESARNRLMHKTGSRNMIAMAKYASRMGIVEEMQAAADL